MSTQEVSLPGSLAGSARGEHRILRCDLFAAATAFRRTPRAQPYGRLVISFQSRSGQIWVPS